MSTSRRTRLRVELPDDDTEWGLYPCSRDLRRLLVLWQLGWRQFEDKLSSTKFSEDQVAYLAWLSIHEPNPYQAFHVRLNDPMRFLIPVEHSETSSPLRMFRLARERAWRIADDLNLVQSAEERGLAETAWDRVVDEIIPDLFPSSGDALRERLSDYDRGFFPVGFHEETSILVAVPPLKWRYGFRILGPGDEHDRIARYVLKKNRPDLERALKVLGVGYRLIVADVEGKETLGDWLRRVLEQEQED